MSLYVTASNINIFSEKSVINAASRERPESPKSADEEAAPPCTHRPSGSVSSEWALIPVIKHNKIHDKMKLSKACDNTV